MKKLFVGILMVCLVMGMAIGASADIKDIECACKEKWVNDYEMQVYCSKNQVKAARESMDMYNSFKEGSEERQILLRAMSKWKIKSEKCNTFDWQMVLYTAKNQLKAYNLMNRKEKK